MKRFLILLFLSVGLAATTVRADDFFCCSKDPLAARDEDGLLHQMPRLNPTDIALRRHCRFDYYFQTGASLTTDPAYVGALQTALVRLGYYCGPIDGVFTVQVSAAIARMQKNYSERVTGTVTDEVRRGLHLP